jgi:hypothetical protein
MWPWNQLHTFESVARELVEGLENGSIVLGNQPEPTPPDAPAQTAPPPAANGAADGAEQQPAKRPA